MVHDLERYLNTLGTVAAVAPLLGLLGTVVGMIRVFTEITVQGTGIANALAGAWEAPITTAAGLVVAIPALVMYLYFTGKIDTIVVGLEQETIKLVDACTAAKRQNTTCEIPPSALDELSINLTPLIDVVFLLLIFFMVSTSFTRATQLAVNLPEAEGQPAPERTAKLELVIAADGVFTLNGWKYPVNPSTCAGPA